MVPQEAPGLRPGTPPKGLALWNPYSAACARYEAGS